MIPSVHSRCAYKGHKREREKVYLRGMEISTGGAASTILLGSSDERRKSSCPSVRKLLLLVIAGAFFLQLCTMLVPADQRRVRAQQSWGRNAAPVFGQYLFGRHQSIPLCAHRGINDANSSRGSSRRSKSSPSASLAASLSSLCVEHSVCCADYDVFFTADRVVMVGHPKEAAALFPTSTDDNDHPTTTAPSSHTAAEFTARDPNGTRVALLSSIVKVVRHLGSLGHLDGGGHTPALFTLEPKCPASLLAALVAAVAEVTDASPLFSIILDALPWPHCAGGSASVSAQTLSNSDDKSSSTCSPLARTLKFALPLKDRDLAEVAATIPDGAIHAVQMCRQLCPAHSPQWAHVIMPSLRFVAECAHVHNITAVCDDEPSSLSLSSPGFLRTTRGQSAAASSVVQRSPPLLVYWNIDTAEELALLRRLVPPPSLHFIVSNRPVYMSHLV